MRTATDHGAEATTVAILESQEHRAFVFTDFENAGNAGMIQASDPLEVSASKFGLCRAVTSQHLDGHLLPRAAINGLEHDTGPPLAELFAESEVAAHGGA